MNEHVFDGVSLQILSWKIDELSRQLDSFIASRANNQSFFLMHVNGVVGHMQQIGANGGIPTHNHLKVTIHRSQTIKCNLVLRITMTTILWRMINSNGKVHIKCNQEGCMKIIGMEGHKTQW